MCIKFSKSKKLRFFKKKHFKDLKMHIQMLYTNNCLLKSQNSHDFKIRVRKKIPDFFQKVVKFDFRFWKKVDFFPKKTKKSLEFIFESKTPKINYFYSWSQQNTQKHVFLDSFKVSCSRKGVCLGFKFS